MNFRGLLVVGGLTCLPVDGEAAEICHWSLPEKLVLELVEQNVLSGFDQIAMSGMKEFLTKQKVGRSENDYWLSEGLEPVSMPSFDGIVLHGYTVEPITTRIGAVFILPPDASRAGFSAWQFKSLSENGYAVVSMDYRGMNGNLGKRAIDLYVRDFEFYLQKLASMTGPIIVVGQSFGGIIAVNANIKSDIVKQIVLDSTPATIARWLSCSPAWPVNRLQYVNVPTRVVVGAGDTIMGKDDVETWRRSFARGYPEHLQFLLSPILGHTPLLGISRREADNRVRILLPDVAH